MIQFETFAAVSFSVVGALWIFFMVKFIGWFVGSIIGRPARR